MKFLSLFKGFGSKRSVPGEDAGWTTGWSFGGNGGDSVDPRRLLENNKEWVYIAVDRNARTVSGVRFKVMWYQKNGDDQEIFQGPLVEFLEHPGEGFTGNNFVYLNTVFKQLTGNAFWEKIGPGQLKPLIPTNVQPAIEGGKLIGYKYQEGGKQRFLKPEQVLHDRYIDPVRPHWGVGKLAKIARWVDISSFSNEVLRKFFLNGAVIGGYIETVADSAVALSVIKAGMVDAHAGVDNAHKWMALPKGSKAVPTDMDLTKMEMGTTDDRYRDKILAAFGVPKTLVGLTTEVNRATAEASEYVYAKYTIKPEADDLLEFLNNNIVPALDPSGKCYFAADEIVPVNVELQLKEREIALGRQPYKTVNEVRAETGLPPVPGGDVVYGSPFQTPLGEPQDAPEPTGDPKDEETPKDDPKEPKKAIPALLRKAIRVDAAKDDIVSAVERFFTKHAPAAATRSMDDDKDAPDERQIADEAAHKSFVSRVGAHEKIVANKVRDFNNKQERDVLQRLNQIVKAVSKGELFDYAADVSALIDVIGPVLKGLMIEQATDEYIAQGFAGTIDTTAARIGKVVDKAAKRLALRYNKTTQNLLAKQLNEGISAGDDIGQLQARVKTVYAFSNEVRSLAVARSESFYIANEGSREAYKQSGVVTSLRWYTAEDEMVCEFCAPEDGRIVGIDEEFYAKGTKITGSEGTEMQLNYRAIDVPPLHTQCRCFIRPESIDV